MLKKSGMSMAAEPATVVTRFAPSPTGFLHIGGARTALFNYLFARRYGGKFLLRIEDTDRKRSTDEAIAAILDGMTWMGLDWDDEVIYQFSRAERHVECALKLVEEGKAYKCFATPEELEEMRAKARAEGRPARYDGRWRDRDPSEAPEGAKPVIRLKAPQSGETVIEDLVQGRVVVANDQLDDMILLRADGTPTYMLSVVVDDHDMGITHVIRGDDHLTNAFRQTQLFKALGWDMPEFAHIPLIHGQDGAKLSKRHGALGVSAYRDMGLLPEAVSNYLLRLGWSHGDDEIISKEQAIQWFDLGGVGRGAARFDIAKLTNLNGHYIRSADDTRLYQLIKPFLCNKTETELSEIEEERLLKAMPALKERAKTLLELAEAAEIFVVKRPLVFEEKAAKLLNEDARAILKDIHTALNDVTDWQAETVESVVREFAKARELGFGKIAQPLRSALTGRTTSPGIFDLLVIFGRDESLARIADQMEG
jgi:glutamyl-tRNA synthetase